MVAFYHLGWSVPKGPESIQLRPKQNTGMFWGSLGDVLKKSLGKLFLVMCFGFKILVLLLAFILHSSYSPGIQFYPVMRSFHLREWMVLHMTRPTYVKSKAQLLHLSFQHLHSQQSELIAAFEWSSLSQNMPMLSSTLPCHYPQGTVPM